MNFNRFDLTSEFRRGSLGGLGAGHYDSNTTSEPQGLGMVPIVIEQSGRGERAYDIYSACCVSASSSLLGRLMITRPT